MTEGPLGRIKKEDTFNRTLQVTWMKEKKSTPRSKQNFNLPFPALSNSL